MKSTIFVLGAATVVALAGEALSATVLTAEPGTGSLFAVRDRIRKLTPEQKRDGVTVLLRPGVYRSNGMDLKGEDDSGVEGAPVVWKAERPGTVRLTTYTDIPTGSFAEWKDGILVAPLGKHAFPRLTGRYFVTNEVGSIQVPHLIVDGKMMTPAQWPNDAWTNIASFVDEGWKTSNGNTPIPAKGVRRGGTFRYSGDRPARWLNDRDYWLEGYWCFDWNSSCIQVKEIDVATNAITLAAPHSYGVRQGNPSPRRWRARHLLSELDVSGEYYVDGREKKLYLMPPKGFDRRTSSVALSVAEANGVTVADAHDIRFENIDFSESWWSLLAIRRSRRIDVRNCRFSVGHSVGLSLSESFDCKVTGCDFIDLGGGGIVLGPDDVETLKPSNNLVEDCLFRFCSLLQLTYAPAIRGNDSVGATIRHCEVTDQPHIGVVINGNDMVFEYNVISNVCYAADDASGYYGGRRPCCQGNEIRHCLLKDIRTRLGKKAGMCGIYLDDGQNGHYVHHTVFVNAGATSVKPNGQTGHAGAMYTNAGFSNRCENCIFVDCVQAFGCYHQTDSQWAWELGKGLKSDGRYWGLHRRLGGLAFFTNELYLAKYPMLKDWLTVYKPAAMRMNTGRNNVVVDCLRRNNPAHGGWDLDETNVVLGKDEDPGFVDRAHANFALRPDSVIYRRLPGFTPIEFEKIGLLRRR